MSGLCKIFPEEEYKACFVPNPNSARTRTKQALYSVYNSALSYYTLIPGKIGEDFPILTLNPGFRQVIPFAKTILTFFGRRLTQILAGMRKIYQLCVKGGTPEKEPLDPEKLSSEATDVCDRIYYNEKSASFI